MTISNRLFDEIDVGDSAETRRVCTDNDLFIFAHASGNLNPLNLPDQDGDGDPSTPPLAPSMWVGALVSNVIGNLLPMTYFNRLTRGILLKGNGWFELWPSIWPLMVFTVVVLGVALRFYRKTLD